MTRAQKRKEFKRLTVKLLVFKFLYYEHDAPCVTDAEYDRIERTWRDLGRALKLLTDEQTTPCVGFDWRHPDAPFAAQIGRYILGLRKHNHTL